jgi:type III restriction enzyme
VSKIKILSPSKSLFLTASLEIAILSWNLFFFDNCPDVKSFAKNYFSINFNFDYINQEGNIANYIPSFIVKLSDQRIFIIETKGVEDLDVPLKMERLATGSNTTAPVANSAWKFLR